MCGICGEIKFNPTRADASAVEAMADTMACRGPDGSGLLRRGPTTLGHRRLKIIDLSETAAQPMADPFLGLAIAFNGCIYNYPELRRDLEQRGHRFFSHNSDTEVILKAYAEWGPDCDSPRRSPPSSRRTRLGCTTT